MNIPYFSLARPTLLSFLSFLFISFDLNADRSDTRSKKIMECKSLLVSRASLRPLNIDELFLFLSSFAKRGKDFFVHAAPWTLLSTDSIFAIFLNDSNDRNRVDRNEDHNEL